MNTPAAHDGSAIDVSLASHGFLAADEPPAFETLNLDGRAPLVLVCDHASNRVPRTLKNLGIPSEELQRHIAWDIGAAALTRRLSQRLDAPAVLAGYSRLVLDLNRRPDEPTAIPETSDGTSIPANRALTAAARDQRIAALFRPYHDAVAEVVRRAAARTPAPIFIAVHSFTPRMNGQDRPWHIGILWHRDGRLPHRLIDLLGREQGLVVGDNLPYSGHQLAFTLDTHAGAFGFANTGLEIRQDLLADTAGVTAWENRLTPVLASLLEDPELRRVERF